MLYKEDLQYAKLYDRKTGELAQNCERDDLIMGPQTRRRYRRNNDVCAVTVCCITYGHEEFIRQTLDGFLMQKTNFKFKVFVGEDHGPDGTADIVREYAAKYPDIIVAFCREENMGAQRNLVDLCKHANSPYIAFCEGDDYWIDEYKLQKQFDYMQSNPKVRMCYTRTEILAPDDWHLNNYYKRNKEGKFIIPDCEPSFVKRDAYHTDNFMAAFPNHTSSAFYRWNYDLKIPDWYFTGLIGDTPMTAMQIGRGRAVYLPDVTSVYRRSDVGVFMSHSTVEHFINTRLDYIRLLNGLESFFNEYYEGAYVSAMAARRGREINNYINAVVKANQPELIEPLFEAYPQQVFTQLNFYKKYYEKYNRVKGKLGENRINLILARPVMPKVVQKSMDWYVKIYNKLYLPIYPFLHKVKKLVAKVKAKKKKLKQERIIRSKYWKYTKVPKEKDLWVITSFRHAGYMDNTMYFYEYMLEHHPEIRLYWATTDLGVVAQLKRDNKPVIQMNTPEGTNLIARAAVAITDHFVTTDYSPQWGFNANTKVVQLWHGVGFKSMGDGTIVQNTKEPGVRYSNDILPDENDSATARMIKKIKYRRTAPFRELFEKYFMLVCPGEERTKALGQCWNIPEETYFMAGHPRDIHIYEEQPDPEAPKIMYAPTYRFDAKHEKELVQSVLEHVDEIQALMEEINGEFDIRLHPHTWRNYQPLFDQTLMGHDRIHVDRKKDVYTTLGSYSLLISDYSSISLDLAKLDRPVIFHCPDYEWFIENEAGFGLDFPNAIPGIMTSTWEETLEQVKLHIENPEENADLRRERITYFFDPTANGPDNSERIAQEIKRRLSLEN